MTTTTQTRTRRVPLRATFGGQIARLDHELTRHTPVAGTSTKQSAARLLSVAELESVRDTLVSRVTEARTATERRSEIVRENRELLARMLQEPEEHRWVRITTSDIDDYGCKQWQSVPRLGVIGMLANWWQIKISSGCP